MDEVTKTVNLRVPLSGILKKRMPRHIIYIVHKGRKIKIAQIIGSRFVMSQNRAKEEREITTKTLPNSESITFLLTEGNMPFKKIIMQK